MPDSLRTGEMTNEDLVPEMEIPMPELRTNEIWGIPGDTTNSMLIRIDGVCRDGRIRFERLTMGTGRPLQPTRNPKLVRVPRENLLGVFEPTGKFVDSLASFLGQ